MSSRTIALPFVGLIAACLVFAEVLRRLHWGMHLELLLVSTLALVQGGDKLGHGAPA